MAGEMNVSPAQIQKYLAGMNYPASKQEVVDYAKSKGADEDTLAVLENMPEAEYNSAADVSKAIGEVE